MYKKIFILFVLFFLVFPVFSLISNANAEEQYPVWNGNPLEEYDISSFYLGQNEDGKYVVVTFYEEEPPLKINWDLKVELQGRWDNIYQSPVITPPANPTLMITQPPGTPESPYPQAPYPTPIDPPEAPPDLPETPTPSPTPES